MPNTVKKYINIDPRHSGLMGQRLQERENTVTPLENPDLEPIPIQSHYQVNPSYWGNTTVNGEPVDITGYRDSNTGIARYQDGEYGYVNLPDNYGEWIMDGVTIYPERPRLKGVVRNYFDDAQQSKILGQSNVIAPIGVGDSEIQPIQFPTKAPEKYHGQDLDRFFANLLTFGTAGTEEYASQLFKEGDYLKGSIYAGLPILVKGGPSGNLLRTGFWGYNLYNDANDAAKMIQDRNGWGYGKDVAKIVLDSGALLYDQTKGLLDAQPYLQDIARQRNNMGYWARTASDITHHPLDTYRTIKNGTYVHNSPSLRRAVAESKQAVSEGADYTRNYYQNALKVDMPEANITAKTSIPGAWGEYIPGTTNFNYTFYRSPFSNLSRNARDFKRVGGHEYTHLAEEHLNNRYFFPLLSVPAKPYYLPNVNHPIMSTATVDDFMEGNIHGRSPEETWANYMGYNAGGVDPVKPFTDYNIEREGIPPPRGFISDYEDYLKSLSGKALQKEEEIQLFNKRYGQKALGGTITNNSDSTILADNNNYIQDFKGRQYGLPTVRYANGGHLFGDGDTVETTLKNYTGYTVNPMYWGNMKTTEGQPITNILGYLGNNQAKVQYNDGTIGIVEYPQNFVQGIAPEVTVYGKSALNRYNTDKAIIDNAYQDKTYEEIAEAKERARQTMDEYAQEHTNEGLTLYKDQLQNQAIQGLVEEVNRDPARDLEWGLGDILSLGTLSAEKRAVDEFNEGNYWNAIKHATMPLMFGRGLLGSASRLLIGGANLAEDVPAAYQNWYQRNYRDLIGKLPGIGLNALLFGHGAYGITDDALNTAAQLGNADAKAIQLARALNKDIGNTALQTNPRSISTEFTIDPVSNNLDAEYTLYDAFGDKMGKGWMAGVDDGTRYVNGIKSTNIGKGVTEDIYNTAVTDTSNGLRSGVTTMYSPQKTLAVTRGKMGYVHEGFNEEGQPVTRITSPSQKPLPQRVDGSHYQEVAPKTTIRFNEATGDLEEVPIKQEEEYVPTSWRFYERGPARISEAERVGIPKGERGMLTDNEKQALEDLSQYRNSGQYRQRFMVDNQENPYWGGVNSEGVNFVQFATDQNFPFKYDSFRVNYSTDTGQGILSYNPNRNMAGYSSRMFTAPSGFKWAPGEANMFINGDNESKIILTAPKTDTQGLFLGDKPASEVIPEEELSSTIDKAIMKDFWTKVRQVQRPGTYLSGDNGRAPKGSDLIQAFKKKQLHKADFKERPLKEQFVTRDGVSPDAFSSIVRQGLRDGSLRWGEGFAKWNNSAVQNRGMYEAWQQYMKNQITAQEYENIYNKWMESLGANKPLQWIKIGNREYPIHPHPYIYQKDLGGSLNILKV